MTAKINTPGKSRLSFKAQTVWTVCSLILAVAIPQILHVIGAVSGLGSSLGEVLLPMHLPIIFAGFAAGPAVGAVSGFFAPPRRSREIPLRCTAHRLRRGAWRSPFSAPR